MDYYTVDEEEENFEALDESGTPFREQLVFLIDTHPEMFRPLNEKQGIQASSLFDLSLRVCIDVMRSRIIESPNDEMSVIFYGTNMKKNESGFENVYVYLDLDATDVQRIKEMCSITDENCDRKLSLHSDPSGISAESLKFGLWASMELLDNKLKTAKTVLLFTPNDNPCAASSQTREQVLNRVQQMRAAQIHLRIFLLPSGDSAPSVPNDSFWKEINEKAKPSDDLDDFDDDVVQRLENLIDSVRRKVHQKRPLASLTMTIIKDLTCAVKLYSLVRPATKGKVLKLDARTNEELVSSTAYICNDTGAKLDEIEELSFQPQRTDPSRYPQIVMKKEDVMRVKHADGDPGITILGFQSVSALRDYHQLCPSLFVFPDERALRGSTTTFIALHETMLQSECLAICRYSKTRNCQIRIAALLPQQETRDEDGCQVNPPGFHLIVLPFMDDIRYPERDPKVVGQKLHYADKEQVDAAASVVDALTLPEDYSTVDIPNPHLQRHYQAIEALALDDTLPDMSGFNDESAPDMEAMRKYSDVVQVFKDAVYGTDNDGDESKLTASGKKRKIVDGEDARTFVSRINWIQLAKDDDLSTLTIDKLKKYLEFYNLPLSGRKADLISRIKAHLAAS